MNEDYLSSINHDLSFRPGIIKEALTRGVKFGTKEFFVYSQLRWYETDGKFGFCVAGDERLGEDVGMTSKEVSNALNRLKECGLVEHVWCDKKVYRNKTKVWMSVVRLSQVCTNVDAIKVLNKGAKNVSVLGKTTSPQVETTSPQVETTSPQVETTSPQVVASPVITGVGNTNRNTKEIRDFANAKSLSSPADAVSDDIKEEKDNSPFDEKVDEIVSLKPKNKNRENAQAWAVAKEMVQVMGHDEREARVAGVGKNVLSLMNSGYTRTDFITLAEWAKTSDFYNDKPLRTILNPDAMQQAVLAKNKNQSSNGFYRENRDGDHIFNKMTWED